MASKKRSVRKNAPRRKPGDDLSVVPQADDITVLTAIRAYREEADRARRTRLEKNRINTDAYLGRQDFSSKIEGQSTEFLPKTSVALEQFVALVKKALFAGKDWFNPVLGRDTPFPLSSDQVRELINLYLSRTLISDSKHLDFRRIFIQGLKSGLLNSLCVYKIHGHTRNEKRRYSPLPGQSPTGEDEPRETENEEGLSTIDYSPWYPRIDVVPFEDYLVDPSGKGLYEIHEVERDLFEVVAKADNGIYDSAAVARIVADSQHIEEESQKHARRSGQDIAPPPPFRRKVKIQEFWGTLLRRDGTVAFENCVCAIANDKYVIRKPEPNPFWHGESPFVVFPLLDVPHSALHKAVYDDAVMLNLALNELFNLMLDGALSSVWGIKQVRLDECEDPAQISGGVSQGMTIAVKPTLPHGQKVLEDVSNGKVPPESMAMYEVVNREFTQSAMSNELKMGSLPQRKTLATEVVELSQSQATLLESLTQDIEMGLSEILRKSFITIMQNADDLDGESVSDAIGMEAATKLSRMSERDRYKIFSRPCAFRVTAMTTMLARMKDFQKMMALLQSSGQNPMMMMALFKKFSPDKIMNYLIRSLAINPEDLKRDDEEMKLIEQDMASLQQFAQLITGRQEGGGTADAAAARGESVPAEVNQASNPLTGMTGGS